MKARPRSIERLVAEYLSREFFTPHGLSPIERIPILGRSGPDLSTNELGLAIDVKSRIEVPKSLFFPASCPFLFTQSPKDATYFVGVPLRYIATLYGSTLGTLDYHSQLVERYWKHMDKWTREYQPDGISAIILHRPTEPIGSAVFVISLSDQGRFVERCQKHLQPKRAA
jgi:hypothetical protein